MHISGTKLIAATLLGLSLIGGSAFGQNSRADAEAATKEADDLRARKTSESSNTAIAKYETAALLWHEVGEKTKEAATYNTIGEIYQELGQADRALALHNKAIDIARALGDKDLEANSLLYAGQAHDIRGEVKVELELYEKALQLGGEVNKQKLIVDALTGIGYVYYKLGELQKAIDYYGRSLPLYRAAKDPDGELAVLVNLGAVYSSLGDPRGAIEYFRQALPIVQALNVPQREAILLNNIGTAYGDLAEYDKALDHYERSLVLRRKVGDRRGEAVTISAMAHDNAKLGNHSKALDLYKQALAIQRELKARRSEGNTLSNIGGVYLKLNDTERAFEYYSLALPIRHELGDIEGESITLHGLASVEQRRGDLAKSLEYIRRAIAIVESVRAELASSDLRASYLALSQDMYQFQIGVLMAMHAQEPRGGYDRLALETSERARARGLLDLLAEARSGLRSGVDADLVRRETALREELNSKDDQRRRTTDSAKAAALDAEIDKLSMRYKELQADIRAKNPRYAELTQPLLLKTAEIQESLDADTILVEYSLGVERSFAWVVSRNGVTSYTLAKSSEIEATARKVYSSLSSPSTTPGPAESLAAISSLLVKPISAELGRKRIVVVADGMTNYLPFGALSRLGDGKPLILDHEIVSIPSASTLSSIRSDRQDRKATFTVAVLADPVFDAKDTRVLNKAAAGGNEADSVLSKVTRDVGLQRSLPRLPGTRREAATIMSLAGTSNGWQALDFAADLETVKGPELAKYRIIHFATHGLIDSQHPELSGVVLSLVDKGGKPKNGYLRLNDIYNLKLSADLIVLSACKSALGGEVKGEGLIGLTRGFMYAGARDVVASLWSVDDIATSELMKLFYQGMLGPKKLGAAAALREAQIAMYTNKRFSSPYFWSAFTIQGDWK